MSDPWTRQYRARSAYDDTNIRSRDSASYAAYSPTTSRRQIAEIERRLAELRDFSETMTRQLGQAERSLHDLDIDRGEPDVARRRRRRHASDVRFSADTAEDWTMDGFDDELRQGRSRHRHHQHTFGGDREALRLEIARLREDLQALRRQCSNYDDVTNVGSNRARHRRCSNYDDVTADFDDDENFGVDELTDWGRSKLRHSTGDFSFEHRSPSCNRCHGNVMSPTCCSDTGLRSILQKPITTQHNKLRMMSPSPTRRNLYDTFDTSNKRAFKPQHAGDVNIGDVIKFRRSGGKMEIGRVMYVGHLPGKSGAFAGVELEAATGNHDGVHNGYRYFQCRLNRGLFVPFDHVVMAWGNY